MINRLRWRWIAESKALVGYQALPDGVSCPYTAIRETDITGFRTVLEGGPSQSCSVRQMSANGTSRDFWRARL